MGASTDLLALLDNSHELELELQPLAGAEESAPSLSLGRSRRTPPWQILRESLGQPRLQGRLWLLAAVLVIISAGAALVTATARVKHQADGNSLIGHGTSNGAESSSAAQPLPAEPWIKPAKQCILSDGSHDIDTGYFGAGALATPLNYRLHVQFTEQHFAVSGPAAFHAATNVTLAIQQDTSCIQLDIVNLTFSSINASLLTGVDQLQGHQATSVCLCGDEAACITTDCARLFKASADRSSSWVLSLGPLLAPAGSTLLLTTRYTAQLSLDGQGMLRSAPFTSQSVQPAQAASPVVQQQEVMISTNLEPFGCSRLFPCMVEPHHKATFAVSVEAPARFTILSNMPEAARHTSGSSSGGGASSVVVEFLPSPPMSAYLMAVAVGHMQAGRANTSRHQLVQVWCPALDSWQSSCPRPLGIAVAALEHYTRYTGIEQPLRKFDLVAVPGRVGALESWGLLLFDPERFLLSASSSAWSVFRSADVICHEVAHQWFGNLATAHSWTDLLVNEGVASLVEYGCLTAVLGKELGLVGATALMRQVVGPYGTVPGVHEGPFAKALGYDAFPTAQALLGGSGVDFGVPVYSKAAALMASLAQYSTTAGGSMSLTGQTDSPVAALMPTDPPHKLQLVLQQYLRSHMYGTATAADLMQLFLDLAPDPMPGSGAAVMAGWRQPGAPLITVQRTHQGLQVTQRRFCASGLLTDDVLTQVMSSSSDSIQPPQLNNTSDADGAGVLEPAAANATGGNTAVPPHLANPVGLLCPAVADGQDRAVTWTPVYVAELPTCIARLGNSSDATANNSCNGVGHSNSSLDGNEPSLEAVHGQWQVIMRDTQLLPLPGVSTADNGTSTTADSADSNTGAAIMQAQQQQLAVLEGDGGWGLYTTQYTPAQRATHRQWVSQQLLPLLLVKQQQQQTAATEAHQHDSMQLVLTAAKLLKDQATLGLSVFSAVPGGEVLAALQAATRIAPDAAAGSANTSRQESSAAGFGLVSYSVLSPLLPLAEELLDRSSVNASCWLNMQAHIAVMLQPVATAAMQMFGKVNSDSADKTSDQQLPYRSTDQFLGAMSLGGILTTAGLAGPKIASMLCNEVNAAATAAAEAVHVTSPAGDLGDELLRQLPPDLRDAALAVAAAQPEGCNLSLPTGVDLLQLLHASYLTGSEPASCVTAAFGLAHSASQATQDTSWQALLDLLLLGLGPANSANSQPAQQHQQGSSSLSSLSLHLACGVPVTKHAVELARIVSRAVTSNRTRQQVALPGHQVVPVAQYLLQQWQQLVSALGHATAWQVLQEVAVQEVLTVQQWQQLAKAVLQHPMLMTQLQQQTAGGRGNEQRQRLRQLLGMTWSTVRWVAANSKNVCEQW